MPGRNTPKKRPLLLTQADEEEAKQITPPKNAKISDSEQETPSPSRLHYQMNALDAALNHYFSPKKKSPGRSPGRAQRKLQFTQQDETSNDDDDEENAQPSENNKRRTLKFNNAPSECDFAAIKNCLEHVDSSQPPLQKEAAEHDEFQNYYSDWENFLQSGEFNILVHGLGSKRKLLDGFQEHTNIKEKNIYQFDGLNQKMSAQSILEQLGQDFDLDVRKRKMALDDWAEALVDGIEARCGRGRKKNWLLLIIHNIDSPQLRPRIQQKALSILAMSKAFRILASVDHVNSALLWDQSLRDSFSWLYFPISTLHCYKQEVLEGNGKLLGQNTKGNTRSHTIESLDMFWEATTSNMRKILEQLAIHAPLVSERNKRDHLNIPRFCQILKEEFATTSETTLRQQLIEFNDHNLIQMDREENILLTVDRQLLSTFLDMKIAT